MKTTELDRRQRPLFRSHLNVDVLGVTLFPGKDVLHAGSTLLKIVLQVRRFGIKGLEGFSQSLARSRGVTVRQIWNALIHLEAIAPETPAPAEPEIRSTAVGRAPLYTELQDFDALGQAFFPHLKVWDSGSVVAKLAQGAREGRDPVRLTLQVAALKDVNPVWAWRVLAQLEYVEERVPDEIFGIQR